MDDTSLQDLENELKALRPRRPSILLRARVEHELSQSPAAAHPASVAPPAVAPRYTSATTLRSWKWFSWQMAAAASVALAVSVGVWRWQVARSPATEATEQGFAQSTSLPPESSSVPIEPTPAPRALAARDTYRPVKAANVLYDLQDEGPVLLEDNTPARRVRARYVDTYTWKNPTTNASLKWSVPRDEVRVMPTRFQ
ncbi:MAG TPA: hypothetical protein VK477_04585 [Acidobacteriota bacterium]|nr:hypothetical protein [Acidobacteriota bacterium]